MTINMYWSKNNKNLIEFVYRLIRMNFFRTQTFFNLYLVNYIKILRRKASVGCKCIASQKVYMRGKGKIQIGNNVSLGYKLGGRHKLSCIELQARSINSKIVIKNSVSTNNNLLIISQKKIEIGKFCLIGHSCEFLDFDGHGIKPTERRTNSGLCESIIIGNNVWFGNNCTVLRGTRIGDNCIVASGAIVKGKFGSNLVIGGVPARIIKKLEKE